MRLLNVIVLSVGALNILTTCCVPSQSDPLSTNWDYSTLDDHRYAGVWVMRLPEWSENSKKKKNNCWKYMCLWLSCCCWTTGTAVCCACVRARARVTSSCSLSWISFRPLKLCCCSITDMSGSFSYTDTIASSSGAAVGVRTCWTAKWVAESLSLGERIPWAIIYVFAPPLTLSILETLQSS